MTIESVSPFLWFDTEAEDAARFYTSLFPNSCVTHVSYYGDGMPLPKGTALVVAFELCGRRFQALNGGPAHRLTEAFSLSVACTTQEDIDHLWAVLTEGGSPSVCGWLKDRFGLSWQIVYAGLPGLLTGPNAPRVMQALMTMRKLDIAALRAAAGS
jgi:predicted 3-demethylubiquinone-9 3-methyltransferase (glyoxalase superfamily)